MQKSRFKATISYLFPYLLLKLYYYLLFDLSARLTTANPNLLNVTYKEEINNQ